MGKVFILVEQLGVGSRHSAIACISKSKGLCHNNNVERTFSLLRTGDKFIATYVNTHVHINIYIIYTHTSL